MLGKDSVMLRAYPALMFCILCVPLLAFAADRTPIQRVSAAEVGESTSNQMEENISLFVAIGDKNKPIAQFSMTGLGPEWVYRYENLELKFVIHEVSSDSVTLAYNIAYQGEARNSNLLAGGRVKLKEGKPVILIGGTGPTITISVQFPSETDEVVEQK